MILDLGYVAKTRDEQLRELGYEEIPYTERSSATWLAAAWDTAITLMLPARTPLELRFKLAGVKLFLEGRYPSGRAIRRELGYDVSGKVHLSGRECRWKNELFLTLHIEPFWWRKEYRELYSYVATDWLPHWRRGRKGAIQRIVYRKVRP
jgi:hypothetical protein